MPELEPRSTIRVTLEVNPTAEPIGGVARDQYGIEHPFTGWVGLAAALEHALASDPERQGDHPREPESSPPPS